MTLLPKELSSSNERCWMLEFPSDDVRPLVHSERQVSVRTDPPREGWIHDGLGGWTNSNWLVELRLA